jgi:hypothetical protein
MVHIFLEFLATHNFSGARVASISVVRMAAMLALVM